MHPRSFAEKLEKETAPFERTNCIQAILHVLQMETDQPSNRSPQHCRLSHRAHPKSSCQLRSPSVLATWLYPAENYTSPVLPVRVSFATWSKVPTKVGFYTSTEAGRWGSISFAAFQRANVLEKDILGQYNWQEVCIKIYFPKRQ